LKIFQGFLAYFRELTGLDVIRDFFVPLFGFIFIEPFPEAGKLTAREMGDGGFNVPYGEWEKIPRL
jgi:hypothetical protein